MVVPTLNATASSLSYCALEQPVPLMPRVRFTSPLRPISAAPWTQCGARSTGFCRAGATSGWLRRATCGCTNPTLCRSAPGPGSRSWWTAPRRPPAAGICSSSRSGSAATAGRSLLTVERRAQRRARAMMPPAIGAIVASMPPNIHFSLGAPFWFDLLGKVSHLRGSGTREADRARKPGPAPPAVPATPTRKGVRRR